MQSIQLQAHVNEQGILQIQLSEHCGEELEIFLVYQPVSNTKKREWSQAFLNTCGAWQGEQLVREPQQQQTEREILISENLGELPTGN